MEQEQHRSVVVSTLQRRERRSLNKRLVRRGNGATSLNCCPAGRHISFSIHRDLGTLG